MRRIVELKEKDYFKISVVQEGFLLFIFKIYLYFVYKLYKLIKDDNTNKNNYKFEDWDKWVE